MFRHRLFGIEFKPTNTMNNQTGTQAPAQAGIEDFNGIFQEQLRGIVRDGLLAMFEQEVTALCGESYRPSASVHRRAGSEMVTIQTTSHYWGQSFRIDFLICQLEDINPKGLTLIRLGRTGGRGNGGCRR